MSCDRTVDIGAYVLGALDPAERSALERHLPTCTPCQAALSDLAGLPGLLSRLSPEEAAGAGVPSGMAALLLTRAARRRTRHLRLVGIGVAAAVILAGLGVGVGLAAGSSSPSRTVVTAASGRISARASLTGDSRGTTTIALSLRGVPPGERCRMYAITTSGQQVDAGSWYATYQGHAGVTETTAADRDEITALQVDTLDGAPLVTLPVRS